MRDRGMAMAILAAAGVAAAARMTPEDGIPVDVRFGPLLSGDLRPAAASRGERRQWDRPAKRYGIGVGGWDSWERVTLAEVNRRRNAAEEHEKDRRKRAEAKKARRRNGR